MNICFTEVEGAAAAQAKAGATAPTGDSLPQAGRGRSPLPSLECTDISRLPGLKPNEAELLLASGVRSASDLAKNDPIKLHAWLREVNADYKLLRKLPPVKRVSQWIASAQNLSHLPEGPGLANF